MATNIVDESGRDGNSVYPTGCGIGSYVLFEMLTISCKATELSSSLIVHILLFW
jgi:hypothetical protein